MGELLKKAASPEVLNQAWKKLKKDKAMWSQGVSRPEMEQNFVYHLTKLSNELSSNKYRPAEVRMFPVAKADGKKRIISALTLRDKLAQKAVLNVLNPLCQAISYCSNCVCQPVISIDRSMDRIKEHLACGFISSRYLEFHLIGKLSRYLERKIFKTFLACSLCLQQNIGSLSYLVIAAQAGIQSFLISVFAGMTVTERKIRCYSFL